MPPRTSTATILLTIPETARELRCGSNTVYRMIARGELEAVDISPPGALKSKTRVSRDAIRAYLRSKARPARRTVTSAYHA